MSTDSIAPVTPLQAVLAKARIENRAALIGYLPAGFPTVDGAIAAMRAMIEGGVDAVEVGLPYSDPVMDGPVIQAAADQALAAGTTTPDVFRTVREIAPLAPVVVMTYWNPVERYGVERFAAELAAAGGSGLITPDITPDEAAPWLAASDQQGLDRIFLVAPSSTDIRLRYTAEHCRGFIYAASTMGVTGAREQVSSRAAELVARLREVTDKPVCVGLGVSTGAQAAEVAAYADGVIVGSAFVRRLLDAGAGTDPHGLEAGCAAIRDLARELAEGVRKGTH
ncbi:tryptophan synthase subunit alpha [Carbonactinospora thermoautotrophica]|uniref:tryptophan synthase subunit alpha n=1 Tax=Carbonactinospora thermoautotrophica TaxID=1469144 RepID=UPI00099E6654|nr:tryptophan synthase subunit alpha [Carbonactinospora thermoautotrophica]